MTDYKRANYLKHEAEIAHRNAQAADTMGRYAEAAWWIVEILLEQGVKVDGRLLQKGKPHASPKSKPEVEAAPAASEEIMPRTLVDPAMREEDPKPKHDPVNHPDHYTRGGIECIDAIQAVVTDLPGKEAWLVGQIIKYVWRYRWKNGAEDLKKARFYLDRLIQEAEA